MTVVRWSLRTISGSGNIRPSSASNFVGQKEENDYSERESVTTWSLGMTIPWPRAEMFDQSTDRNEYTYSIDYF